MRARKMSQGMTLIESVLAIVILAIALITLTSFLFPSVQKSALPHYQVRAASLGQAVLNQILAVSFDEQSDRNGSLWRCDELDKQCTSPASLGPDKNEQPAFYNDVDDYIGCWYGANAQQQCQPGLSITRLLGGDEQDDYRNFVVNILVSYDYDNALGGQATPHQTSSFKKIIVRVSASNFTEYEFVAYKGNY
ncbi:type IV pilus modification PilV family protein [Vibrio mediterranei]|uniref:Type II secretion system protein n=1 Tax=Vibrio mediterranei TaxID=689 RepID=A0A3G4VD83_9VIBR|nr:type II secretion system protein [Vibrio mediterranei]AYV21858.1 type II secretion system protein [Vibrio mediterranei]